MKKRIIQLMLCALIYISTNAQTSTCAADLNAPIAEFCEDGHGIQTDPDDPANNECPNLKNEFEWRVKHQPGGLVPDELYYAYNANGNLKRIRNPFNDASSSSEYAHLAANHGSNYNPEDGWELLKSDFGTLSNIGLTYLQDPGQNINVAGPKLPYMILYNKYSGTFRFFGALLGQNQGYETIRIELRIPKISPELGPTGGSLYQSDLKATNLLSIQGDAVQPLDQETTETSMSIFAKCTNNENQFFWFDIPVAYDPCLCNIRSQLDINFQFIKTAEISLNGVINAGIKTETKNTANGPQEYGLKLAQSVLAAGLSTAVTVKSGGAVVNVKAYTDLINLIKNNPNSSLSQTQKDNLGELSSFVTCTSKMMSVVKKNYEAAGATAGTDKEKKTKYEAAQNIIDANTTFISSLTKGCSSGDNGASVITGAIKLSGTFTETNVIDQTEILLAMPGSNWTDKQMQINRYKDDNLTVAAYPTYNERLGTFALLETPKVQLYSRHISGQGNIFDPSIDVFRFLQQGDIKYTFNPVLNVNEEETDIQFRYVIKQKKLNILENTINFRGSTFKNQHLLQNEGMEYPVSTHFLPLEYYNNFQKFVGIQEASFSEQRLRFDSIFIQFKVVMISNDIGSNGPNEAFYFFTYPVNVEHIELSDIPLPNIINEQTMQQHVQAQAWRNLQIDAMFKPLSPELKSGGKDYNQDIVFNSDEIFAFDGIVEISAKMSTTGGKKIIIYSTLGFDIQPGAEISSNIELVIGYPFTSSPLPPQSYSEVSSFCSNSNKYKAQEFSTSALLEEKETYLDRQQNEEEAKAKRNISSLEINLYPNPTKGEFTLEFDYPIQDVKVTVLDLNGKEVFTSYFSGDQSRISLDAKTLEAGVYFIEINTPQGKVGRERLVKY